MRALIVGALLNGAWLGAAGTARAEMGSPVPTSSSARDSYVHVFGAVGYGRGLRLNNPYRLQTELGESGESLSLSAGYLDVAVGATLGDPHGLQHGAVAHLSLALQGIRQEVVSVSYLALHPLTQELTGFARAGVPLVLEPDASLGFELGAGAVYFFSAGLGLTAELTSSLFFGAATWERDPTVVPVLSLQLGVWVDYEVLP